MGTGYEGDMSTTQTSWWHLMFSARAPSTPVRFVITS